MIAVISGGGDKVWGEAIEDRGTAGGYPGNPKAKANWFSDAATPQLETQALLQQYPSLSGTEPAANSLKHLWIPIGDKDFLLARNDKFVEQLRTAGVKHDYVKTEGGHEWKLWRDYLPQFLEKVVGK